MTIREMAERVRARNTGARELVSESLRRIEALDDDLNAVVALRAERWEAARPWPLTAPGFEPFGA